MWSHFCFRRDPQSRQTREQRGHRRLPDQFSDLISGGRVISRLQDRASASRLHRDHQRVRRRPSGHPRGRFPSNVPTVPDLVPRLPPGSDDEVL